MSGGERQAPLLTIGYGGWTLHFPGHRTLSHYGDTWKGHAAEIAADAVGVDLTAIPEGRELAVFAISGPMPCADVASGQLDSLSRGGTVAFDPRPVFGRDPDLALLGNARGLDRAAPDVYARLAERFGARVFRVHGELSGEGDAR